MNKRDLIFTTLDDLISDFLYYDRKEDDVLTVGEIENQIRDGNIEVSELVNYFTIKLQQSVKE